LLTSRAVAFNATKERWTLGRLIPREERVEVRYMSQHAPPCEVAQAEDCVVIGRAFGYLDGATLNRFGV
jgi:hypothetical protein